METEYVPLRSERILAVDPISRGFGFVVLEGEPFQLVDWGVKVCARRPRATCEGVLGRMIARYEPTAVVCEDPRNARALRRAALKTFMEVVADALDEASVPVHLYSRRAVRETFSTAGAYTKEAITRVLVGRFPELLPRVPRRRRVWESEDRQMSIFDALSFAAAHLSAVNGRLRDVA